MKKKFDAVAFMRKRREELSHAYVGLTWSQIEERIQQALKDILYGGKVRSSRDHRRPGKVQDAFDSQAWTVQLDDSFHGGVQ